MSPAAAQRLSLSIPATTLDDAITRLGAAAGVDVVSTEPGLARLRSRPVSGRLTPADALATLLRGSGYRAVAIDRRSFRIVRDARPAPVPAPPQVAAAPTTPAPIQDVIVTASKQRIPLLRYPGSLTTIVTAAGAVAEPPADLSSAARVTPVLQNTEFGPGRNKIFIRGIADSSFNGAAQSTASVYLGDVQLGYSGADPSVKLYDVASVQVMEGPQGTLYGSGSIGGIVRIEPVTPVLDRVAGEASGGVTLTQHGEIGGDVGAVLNLPLVREIVAVRAVAYRTRDGGYIDDLGSLPSVAPRHDVNAIDTVGGRLALRVAPGAGWRIDVTGAFQRIDVADAQYADQAVGMLARRTAFAQPYDNEFALGSVAVGKDWASGLQLRSVVGLASTHGHNVYDATVLRAPGNANATSTVYGTSEAKRLLTGETRLSRSLASGWSWVVGLSLVDARDAENRSFGLVAMPAEIIGVTNVTRTASVFAEATVPVWPAFSVTAGGRVTIARTDGEPSFRPRVEDFVRGRSTRRFDPTVAFSWRLAPALTAFGRAQTGYRTGGLAVSRGVGRVADFRSDSIRMGELGLRWLRRGETGLSATTAFSLARWTSIQADIINRRGLPYTDNIGNAQIEAFEGTLDWVPVRGVSAVVNFLQTYNRTTGSVASSSSPAHRRLPETPPFALSGELGYGWTAHDGDRWRVAATVLRVGRSVIGTGDLLDIDQGKFTTLGASVRWQRGRYELSLIGENLTDSRGNLFSQGNPFDIALRDLSTPLRPANVRLGARVNW